MPPERFIGAYFVVWLIISAALICLFLVSDPYAGWISYLLVGGFVAIGGYSVVGDFRKNQPHPILDLNASQDTSLPTRFWDQGMFKTPLIAVAMIALVLLVAALIGYVNFIYF